MQIKVGSKISNNDLRYPGQVVTIESILENVRGKFAIYNGRTRICKVRFDRIRTNKNEMSYNKGWTLVDDTD